jgi:hypothetical protein
MPASIGQDQGWMIELILDEDIQVIWQPEMKVIGQMGGVVSPGE